MQVNTGNSQAIDIVGKTRIGTGTGENYVSLGTGFLGSTDASAMIIHGTGTITFKNGDNGNPYVMAGYKAGYGIHIDKSRTLLLYANGGGVYSINRPAIYIENTGTQSTTGVVVGKADGTATANVFALLNDSNNTALYTIFYPDTMKTTQPITLNKGVFVAGHEPTELLLGEYTVKGTIVKQSKNASAVQPTSRATKRFYYTSDYNTLGYDDIEGCWTKTISP